MPKFKVWVEDKRHGAVLAEATVLNERAIQAWISAQKRAHGYQALLEPIATWQGKNGELVTFKVKVLTK